MRAYYRKLEANALRELYRLLDLGWTGPQTSRFVASEIKEATKSGNYAALSRVIGPRAAENAAENREQVEELLSIIEE